MKTRNLSVCLFRFFPFLLLVLLAKPAQAAGVVGSGSPGSCTQSALAAALNGGGLVTFNCGGAHTMTLTGQQTITVNTTIDGAGLITLSGGGSTRIFNIQNGATVTIRNLTIANGYSSEDGGGIYAERLSTLIIENSTLINNTGRNGGGLATNGWGAHDAGVAVTISGSTFTNNTATAVAIPGGGNGGGGIYLSGGSAATVTDSIFSGNHSQNGGAIHLLHSDLHTVNVAFHNNTATNTAGGGGGGAIYMDGTKNLSGELLIERSTFTGNSTNQLGGAIFSYITQDGRTTINQSTFNNNLTTGGNGGAIYHQSGTGNAPLTVNNSTFIYNTATAVPTDRAGQGGALWLIDSPVTITNSTFAYNEAVHTQSLPGDDWHRGFGGAIRTSDNTTIINSTFAHNHAGFVGGAIAGPATVRNSIISQNTGGNVWQIQQNCTTELNNNGHNIQFPQRVTGNGNDYECFAGQMAVNPLLGGLGDYGGPTQTIPLLAGSPAINAATNCPTTDQRGFARNGPCDIGAYEYGGGLLLNSISPSMSGLNAVQSFTLAAHGVGFSPSTVVRWEGTGRTTTYVSEFMVTAVIPASDVDEVGVFNVTVYDPDRSLESLPLPFTVVPMLYRIHLPFIRK
ncbi:MAG: calcium-binding protein [Chloroflexi bacterium]|nr:calcium-binding protein [Ardenticatenaceae bacterium]MBL1129852.1 calcium-binding protein [Chloroflexota bacterium]NOG35937.1 calcium-binding protein [Chloroflexota bacterium]GIK56224.1 MAG: membrane protein [Chloroflexota bacterium]